MMHIIILWGPSGAGKSYARKTDKYLQSLPCVDLGDVVRDIKRDPELDNFRSMMNLLIRRIRGFKTETVVVEGHFLPHSPSRSVLANWIKISGNTVEWRQFNAPLEIRRDRLRKDIQHNKPNARHRMQQLERDRIRYGI